MGFKLRISISDGIEGDKEIFVSEELPLIIIETVGRSHQKTYEVIPTANGSYQFVKTLEYSSPKFF